MATDTVAAPALPDDVLEDILGRLPARSLAASQLVCKAWRDLVGERRLLFRLLLPHSVAGLFVNYIDHFRPHFFAPRPPPADGGAAQTAIDGTFSFIARDKPYEYNVLDHCNGLVLHSGDVRNWKPRAFVVFDPAVSPHWEVLLVHLDPHKFMEKQQPGKKKKKMEWPWHVFSSTTMRWEEKVFIGEGEAAGTVANLLPNSWGDSL